MNKTMRELVDKVRPLGWSYEGPTNGGHGRMVHEDGHEYTIASTPSEYRSAANMLADLERICGEKLERPNHRRSRKSMRVEPDPAVEASRRRHASTFAAKEAEREAVRAENERQRVAALVAAEEDRRRRAIEELMR